LSLGSNEDIKKQLARATKKGAPRDLPQPPAFRVYRKYGEETIIVLVSSE
jgi:hypothetical protein